MSNETMINPINNSNSTVINSELQPNNATVINTEISNLSNIAEGTTLCDKYKVESKLDINTGEADLYVCDYNGEKFIAKIYRRKFAVKPEVTNILKEIDSPYIAKLYETGTINGMPFEILPYYKNGSIQGRKFTYEELKNNIIPCINAGLKALHYKEIIHKDLKPSNIMLCDNGKDVAIIDFGISSVRESGNTVVMTRTGMT
ncbi:MAG: protein kinase, partial [Clostridia bacterium]|nr:protein kinase [Clostridia bacterium]